MPTSSIHRASTRRWSLFSVFTASVAFRSLPARRQAVELAGTDAGRRFVTSCCLLLLALIASAGTASPQSFSTPTSYSVGANPNSGTAGDFNGDGKPDLAIGNVLGLSVSVLLNNGNGTFQNAVNYPVDRNPEGIATGDFNSDGKLDLAAGNFLGGTPATGNISILIGNGNGTFQAAVNYDAGSPYQLRVADLNGDGKLDLVAASWTSNKVSVLLGNGNGTFQSVVAYSTGTEPHGVAVADFNGDGKPDLAVTNVASNEISILPGNGDGTFQPAVNYSATSGPAGVAAYDFNGDGKQDLVIAAINSNALLVLLGNGNGTFQTPVSYAVGAQPQKLELGDFNGDGKMDVVVVNSNAPSVSVLRGNGDGTFQSAFTFPANPSAFAPVVGDFDTDGKPDLAILRNGFGRVDVLLNSPSAHGVAINATAGVSATVLVATFFDYDTSKTASSFTSTINWGDGSAPTSGTISSNGAGGFNVTGTHTYSAFGTYSVNVQIADSSGNFATVTDTATVKANQTITFGVVANKTYGDPDFTVSPTASSNLPVNLAATGSCTVTAVSPGTVHITGAGLCTITASQSGNSNYNAAPDVPQSFIVADIISINDVSTTEGNSGTKTADFTVTLAVASNLTVTVNYQTANGTGTAGSDYQAGSGTVTFNPGQTSQTISVTINGDQSFEPDETFFVNLSGSTNATIADNQGLGTIVNDDAAGGIFRFSQNSYTVAESGGSQTITVERTGDLTLSATVDYASADDSDPTVTCGTVTGNASSRCDFTTAIGTLDFAAGVGSKTFTVLINQDSYVEGPETLTLTLSNPTNGAVLGVPDTAILQITDDATEPSTNAIDATDNFVRQHYLDFLHREPDAGGFNAWMNVLNGCAPGNTSCDRVAVSGSFFGSPEFQTKGYFATRFYFAAFARDPLFVEMMRDLSRLNGVTPAESNAAKANFPFEFTQRAEFHTKYDNVSNANYVDTMIANTGVAFSQSSRNQMIIELDAQVKTRAQVLQQIVDATQFVQNAGTFNRAYILAEYWGYLRRNPDTPGLNNWINYLNAHPGDFRTMVNGFVNSIEYRKRFGTP